MQGFTPPQCIEGSVSNARYVSPINASGLEQLSPSIPLMNRWLIPTIASMLAPNPMIEGVSPHQC